MGLLTYPCPNRTCLFWKCHYSLLQNIVRLLSTSFFHMMTSSNGNIFRVTGPLCGEFTGPGEFPTQRPVTRSFDIFFDLRLNKRLSKQPWGWWFDTSSCSLWRQCNKYIIKWIGYRYRNPRYYDRLIFIIWVAIHKKNDIERFRYITKFLLNRYVLFRLVFNTPRTYWICLFIPVHTKHIWPWSAGPGKKSYMGSVSWCGCSYVTTVLIHWGRDKMATILQMIYSNSFSLMICMNFDENFTEVCS